jgi:hypothetical protein
MIQVEGMKVSREHVFPGRNDPKQAMNSQTANTALKPRQACQLHGWDLMQIHKHPTTTPFLRFMV